MDKCALLLGYVVIFVLLLKSIKFQDENIELNPAENSQLVYDYAENVPKLTYSHSMPSALIKSQPGTPINNVNDNRSNAIKTPTGDLTLRSADISSSDVILAPTETADGEMDDDFVSDKGHDSINMMAADTQIVEGGESVSLAKAANVIKTSAAAAPQMISVGGVGGRQIGQESG